MGTANLVAVAEQVRADLAAAASTNYAGGPLGLGDTPRIAATLSVSRVYVPRFKPAKQSEGVVQVQVSTDSEQTKRIDRSTLEALYLVDIGVCCNLTAKDDTTIDGLLFTLEQIADYWFDFDLTNRPEKWEHNDVYLWPDRDELKRGNAFFALWTATFRGSRRNVTARP